MRIIQGYVADDIIDDRDFLRLSVEYLAFVDEIVKRGGVEM